MSGGSDPRPAEERLAAGWRHLAAFFHEGRTHLAPAVAAFREAERLQRGAGGGEPLVNTLLGLSLALRLRRDADEARQAVVLAQELVNIVRRHRSAEDTLSYRRELDGAYRDLADVERGEEAAAAAEAGIEACDRTLTLARRLRATGAAPPAQATKAALLVRLDELRPGQGSPRRRGDALRLFATALDAWPERDVQGRAAAACDFAEALAAGREAERAVRIARDAALVLHDTGNRYLEARAARAEAHAALAAGRPDAVDLVVAAAASFRALECEWEARQVEALV